MMLDDTYEIDITLSLQKWDEPTVSFDATIMFCQDMMARLRNKFENYDPIFHTKPVISQETLYRICSLMLNIAKSHNATLDAVEPTKKEVLFKLRFENEENYDLFYSEFVYWMEINKFEFEQYIPE